MEILKVIRNTGNGSAYMRNAVAYPLTKGQVAQFGYGVNPYDVNAAVNSFSQVAKYYGNENKNPVFHFVLSYDKETADSPEAALNVTKEIFAPLGEEHLMVIGIHEKERGSSEYHAHAVMSPTNLETGRMFSGCNNDLFGVAQRVADITENNCKLEIEKKGNMKADYSRTFSPSDCEAE